VEKKGIGAAGGGALEETARGEKKGGFKKIVLANP